VLGFEILAVVRNSHNSLFEKDEWDKPKSGSISKSGR